MAIETIGSQNNILKTGDTASWVKKSGISNDGFESFSMGDVQKTFSEMLADSISEVNKYQEDANTAIQKLISGETKNLHETMLAVEKADIAFKTMNQIRTRVIDAYREIMRMQV